MVPSGPPTPIGGAQSVPPSLLRSNSGLMGPQGGGPLPGQAAAAFSSLVSPRTQFNSMNMLGNVPNVSSLLNQPFAADGGVSGPDSDRLSGNNGMSFSGPNNLGNQILPDQIQSQQLEPQGLGMQQFAGTPQQQYQAIRGA